MSAVMQPPVTTRTLLHPPYPPVPTCTLTVYYVLYTVPPPVAQGRCLLLPHTGDWTLGNLLLSLTVPHMLDTAPVKSHPLAEEQFLSD